MESKKIAYIIGYLGKGGAEKQLYELLKGINRQKFQPIVICLSEGGYWGTRIRELGIKVIEIPRKSSWEFSRLIKLVKLLKGIKPEIVHTYLFSANSYGRIAAIIAGVPVIIASERSLPELRKDKNIFQICIDGLFALFTDGIICNSNKASALLAESLFFNKQKIFTIHNGISIADATTKSYNINKDRVPSRVIGTVGNLYSQKNHRLFLNMAKIVLDKLNNPDLSFIIVGDGILRSELINYSQSIGISNKVVFAGLKDDIPAELAKMDVFVMTSSYEGMSNAIMEAMLAKLPIVATDVGGNSELIIDGKTGFLCTANEALLLAQKVILLLNNDQLAGEMGRNGRQRIMSEFPIEKMIKKTGDIYTELLKRKGIVV